MLLPTLPGIKASFSWMITYQIFLEEMTYSRIEDVKIFQENINIIPSSIHMFASQRSFIRKKALCHPYHTSFLRIRSFYWNTRGYSLERHTLGLHTTWNYGIYLLEIWSNETTIKQNRESVYYFVLASSETETCYAFW